MKFAPTSRKVQIVRRIARVSGAGWIALTLRELARSDLKFSVDDYELSEVDEPLVDAITVNIVGLDPSDGIAAVTDFLQRQRSPRAMSFVSSSRLSSAVEVLVRECGAVAVIDSIDSAKLAARTIGRFFDAWPLSTSGPLLRQLPWNEFSTRA